MGRLMIIRGSVLAQGNYNTRLHSSNVHITICDWPLPLADNSEAEGRMIGCVFIILLTDAEYYKLPILQLLISTVRVKIGIWY